ncbi:MAG: glycosyltransferase [Gemmataceae bacterium]|nr:glycosyltransferase [Gemmataceae bacterium]MDW8265815.1 glycosyltransferase [Gemmataceae bacterium]
MIVRNEEKSLPACLQSVSGLVDEIVVVDTGSTDQTRAVASAHGARVVEFAWCDSFAAARNESLRHATGDWIFWMDADDRLDSVNRERFRQLRANLPDANVAYLMACWCAVDAGVGAADVVHHIRLFRSHPEIRFEYRVHEQVLPSIARLGGSVQSSDVVIHHVGYQTAADSRRKHERNLRLLQLDLAEAPNNPFTLFNLGWTLQVLGRYREAIPYLRQGLALAPPHEPMVRKLCAVLVLCHEQLGEVAEALAVSRHARSLYPDDEELLFREGVLRMEAGDVVGAEECLWAILRLPARSQVCAGVDTALRGKTRHNLAVLYRSQGRLAEAEAQWRAALAEGPDFGPLWAELTALWVSQGRWDELLAAGQQLESDPQRWAEAAVVRSAILEGQGHVAEARRVLEAAIVREPRSLILRMAHSALLLREGRDWQAMVEAQRALLALQPNYTLAHQRLAALLQQRPAGVVPQTQVVSW